MEKKLQKTYIANFNLLIAQHLWQAHYQILSTVFVKEFKELSENIDMMIKNVRLVEFNISVAIVFLYKKKLKMI